ncbi:sulfatase-modifying factor protein [Leptolyngbya sp. Heron Island J]|uniref:caspase, EACC1-associated type n=1 Tax=Leptolyngbya sp. Heron Island J TaxID=1385935 RepID=UPI0003B9B87D|nr:SUMF1/EgtB/PvdO family nonheme iron enzyme [Leptolyngbya sp. Heron Island J]ESA32115.1 sulfatase-modifying factor protein [Leptolyngbya sp. Heron Island J]
MGKYALLIGIAEYPDGLTNLPAATEDVAALERVLVDKTLGGFDHVQTLTDLPAGQLTRAIELWFADRQPDDLALLFFSGHGLKDERRDLYFAASNTEKIREKLVTSTAVAARNIHNFICYSRCKHQIVILDCCFSGAFGDVLVKDDGEVPIEDVLGAEGRVVLTSTNSVGYSFGDEEGDGPSIYTRYLVEGIEKGAADLNGDGWISVDELHEFASRKVQEESPAMSPKIITLRDEGYKLIVARSPQDKPEVKYRKAVEKKARTGKFTIPARRQLHSLRRQYGLSEAAAKIIEEEVLQPYREYQRKLAEYRETLQACLEEESPLSQETIVDLKDYQKHLSLKDDDVRPMEKELVGQAIEVEVEVLGEKTKPQQFVAQEDSSKKSKTKQYPTFPFKTAKVDEQGNVIEIIPGKAEHFAEDLGNGLTLEMVRVPGGTFMMGAAEGEAGASEDEYPQHEVKLPEFWMGKFTITQEQWQAVANLQKIGRDLKSDPSRFKDAKRPVENVTWQDAEKFCKRLSQKTGKEYTLPSEAQWEYACRARMTTPFHFGLTISSELANYDASQLYGKGQKGEYRQKTTEVGSFAIANAFGLYDMHGNVWEWCLDSWHDSYEGAPTDGSAWISSGENRRVLRGGSWLHGPGNCRSANRDGDTLGNYYSLIGFRVVCFPSRT